MPSYAEERRSEMAIHLCPETRNERKWVWETRNNYSMVQPKIVGRVLNTRNACLSRRFSFWCFSCFLMPCHAESRSPPRECNDNWSLMRGKQNVNEVTALFSCVCISIFIDFSSLSIHRHKRGEMKPRNGYKFVRNFFSSPLKRWHCYFFDFFIIWLTEFFSSSPKTAHSPKRKLW